MINLNCAPYAQPATTNAGASQMECSPRSLFAGVLSSSRGGTRRSA